MATADQLPEILTGIDPTNKYQRYHLMTVIMLARKSRLAFKIVGNNGDGKNSRQ
jgi:hypothetical protein